MCVYVCVCLCVPSHHSHTHQITHRFDNAVKGTWISQHTSGGVSLSSFNCQIEINGTQHYGVVALDPATGAAETDGVLLKGTNGTHCSVVMSL